MPLGVSVTLPLMFSFFRLNDFSSILQIYAALESPKFTWLMESVCKFMSYGSKLNKWFSYEASYLFLDKSKHFKVLSLTNVELK